MRLGLAWGLPPLWFDMRGNGSSTMSPWTVIAGRKCDRPRKTITGPTQRDRAVRLPCGTINERSIAGARRLAF